MHMTLAHLQCKNVVLSTTATKQLARARKKMRFSIFPNNGASSRIWAYGFYSFHVEYNSQQYCSKKRKLPNDASKCFYVSGFTNRVGQSFFSSFMPFKTFTFDSFVFPLRNVWRCAWRQKQVTRSEAESNPQAFIMFHVIVRITWIFSHSGSLVTMSWCPPYNNRKCQLFAP